MPDPITALVAGGTSLAGSVLGAKSASKASEEQTNAANRGIGEQQRQFDQMRATMMPYLEAGGGQLGNMKQFAEGGLPAYWQQQNMLGLGGAQAQQDAIQGIANSPMFNQLAQQGENAMLQNASATGGLRGGNTQGMLAQYRPQMLQQLIDQQYNRLGGIAGMGAQATQNLATMGQNTATMQSQAGMNLGANLANAQTQIGDARAGNTLAQGQAGSSFLNLPMQLAGMNMGTGGGGSGLPNLMSMFGGGGTSQVNNASYGAPTPLGATSYPMINFPNQTILR